MIYYNKEQNTFFDDSVHEDIPPHSIEITEEKHAELLLAINSGCIILDDLSISVPRPDAYHTWSENGWVMTQEAVTQKASDEAEAEKVKISSLLSDAAKRISEYQDLVDFAETPEAAAAGEAGYNAWRQYRASLLKYQKGLIADMPLQPE